MSELEALSNKELRVKCQEYGMPNVPVTDSSRKILIRRLEAAMTKPKPNRRETMHVSKPSEIASSPKITINNNNTTNTTANKATPAANRASRRTIAVPERHVATTTTVSEPEYSDVSPDRGEEQQKPIQMPKAKTPEKPASTSLYPKLPMKEPSPKPQFLSKTGVVTTSFVQESQKKGISNTYAAPDDIDSAEEDLKTSSMAPPLTSYIPLSESKVTTSNPMAASLSSTTRYSSLGSSGLSYKQIQAPTSYTNSPMTTSSNVWKTSAGSTTTSSYGQYSRMAVQPSSKYVEYEDNYMDDEVEDSEEDMGDDDDVVVVEDSPVGKDIQTPFLSQFARNLENLKATPLRHSIGPTKITPPKSSAAALRNRETASGSSAYTRRTVGAYGGPSNIAPRRSLKSSQTEDDSPFRQFMMTMEEKYHLKHTFFLISIFIIAVFIYVFFIQSV